MTAYKDFISDFPRRCHKLLEMAESAAHLGGLDVTQGRRMKGFGPIHRNLISI
jgi:hypothetical protein